MTAANVRRHPSGSQGGAQETLIGLTKGKSTTAVDNFYFKFDAWVVSQHQALTPTQRFVLHALKSYANTKQMPAQARPLIETLANYTGYGERTITRATEALAEAGLIRIERIPRRRNLNYVFLWDGGHSDHLGHQDGPPEPPDTGHPVTDTGHSDIDTGHRVTDTGHSGQLSTNELLTELHLSPVEPEDDTTTSPRKSLQERVEEAIWFHGERQSEAPHVRDRDEYAKTARHRARQEHGPALYQYARQSPDADKATIVDAVILKRPAEPPRIEYAPSLVLPPRYAPPPVLPPRAEGAEFEAGLRIAKQIRAGTFPNADDEAA